MLLHPELQTAILENPDDDTPRLVYADYLDQQDETRDAEFIRAQIFSKNAVDNKLLDSDEYVYSVKSLMGYDSDYFYYRLRHDNLISLGRSKTMIDVYEEVVRVTFQPENSRYFFERGWLDSVIMSDIQICRSYSQDLIKQPIRKISFGNLGSNQLLIHQDSKVSSKAWKLDFYGRLQLAPEPLEYMKSYPTRQEMIEDFDYFLVNLEMQINSSNTRNR